MFVDTCKCAPDFSESFCSKGAEGDAATTTQQARGFRENQGVITPLDGQTGPPQIKAALGKGQLFDIGGKVVAGFFPGDFQHGWREVHGAYSRPWPFFLHQARAITRAAAGVKNVRAGRKTKLMGGEQPLADPPLY